MQDTHHSVNNPHIEPDMPLEQFQRDLCNGIYHAWNSGAQNVVATMATGLGKSYTVAHITRELAQPTTVIAHRNELVAQLSMSLAGQGIRHGIVGPKKSIQRAITEHMDTFKRSYYDARSQVQVCSVQSLIGLSDSQAPWIRQSRYWVTDECFVAGTMIRTPNGRVAIESLRVGDEVVSYDEKTGVFVTKTVSKVFQSPAPDMLSVVRSGGEAIVSTLGHPFYTEEGWRDAAEISVEDRVAKYPMPELRDGRARSRRSSSGIVVNSNGGYESCTRFGPNEVEKPDAQRCNTRKNVGHAAINSASAEDTRRERQAADRHRVFSDYALPASSMELPGKNRHAARVWIPALLQTGLGFCRHQVGRGMRWAESFFSSSRRSGEGRNATFARVDSAQVVKRSDLERLGVTCDRVYNFHVEGTETYVANGFVVHNCHHILRDNVWGEAIARMPYARGLGVTATLIRAEGSGLGRDYEGVFDAVVEGPQVQEGIDMGFLTPYRIVCPKEDVDVSDVPISDSTGDFNKVRLREKIRDNKSLIGNVVKTYKRFAESKSAIVYVVDIEEAGKTAKAFREAGIAAEAVSSKTPDELRASILRDFKAKRTAVLINVDLFGEGFDVPGLEVVIMARHTASLGLYMQMVGRALRLDVPPDLRSAWSTFTPEERREHIAASRKPFALIIDHVGNVIRHRPPCTPRVWSLERRDRKSRSTPADAIPITTCLNESCLMPYEKHLSACPHCGANPPLPTKRSSPAEVEGDMVMLDPREMRILTHEIARVTSPVLIPGGLTPAAIGALKSRHRERHEAQIALRGVIAQWAGQWHTAGESDREISRRFWHTFGVDVMTAQTLSRADAEKLQQKIEPLLPKREMIWVTEKDEHGRDVLRQRVKW